MLLFQRGEKVVDSLRGYSATLFKFITRRIGRLGRFHGSVFGELLDRALQHHTGYFDEWFGERSVQVFLGLAEEGWYVCEVSVDGFDTFFDRSVFLRYVGSHS